MKSSRVNVAKQQQGERPALPRLSVPTVGALASSAVALRRASAGPTTELSRDEREQLIADARAGKLVNVHVEAVTFLQRATPNRNLVRFSTGALRSMAPSFAGMPVLRDHAQDDALARGGRVLESRLEDHPTDDGVKQIRMTLELTAPWAVEMALRGLMDRFSIGWHSTGDTVCSVCEEPMTRFWFFTLGECEHELGAEYDGQICQLEFTSAEGIEVSAVSVPAVLGTGVDDIRAQLSAARAACPAVMGRKELPIMSKSFPLILAALALSADADEASAVTAIEALRSDIDGARAAAQEATSRATGAESRLAELASAGKAQRLSSLLATGLSEGRYLPGGSVAGHVQKLAARGDEDGLVAYLADLPARGAAPLGGARQSAAAAPSDTSSDGVALTEGQAALCKQLGITPAEFAQHSAKLAHKKSR